MSHTSIATPTIIYTVMSDFGEAYCWMTDDGVEHEGVGVCIAGCNGWHGKHPVSSELHEAFMAWQAVFEEEGMLDYGGEFDQIAFDASGLALTRRLKTELGDRARVIYEKVESGPDERCEVLADGLLMRLPSRSEMLQVGAGG